VKDSTLHGSSIHPGVKVQGVIADFIVLVLLAAFDALVQLDNSVYALGNVRPVFGGRLLRLGDLSGLVDEDEKRNAGSLKLLQQRPSNRSEVILRLAQIAVATSPSSLEDDSL